LKSFRGRLCEPPTKWHPKRQLVRFWCIYTTKLELTLAKISEKIHSLRPAAVPPSGTASQKNFLYNSDLRAPPKNSSKKEKEVFLLGSALRAGGGKFARTAQHFYPAPSFALVLGPHPLLPSRPRLAGWRQLSKLETKKPCNARLLSRTC
jgi:hypothetical protein